jgi:hypothetical protein
LNPGTIISFLSIHPGLRASEEKLHRRCIESEIRLNKSGYVYSSSIMTVTPVRNPEERTVIVSVTPGFFLRFGGGKAWGMFGKAALGGDRATVLAYGGYNKNGFEYMHSRVGGIPLALGGRFFYYGPGGYDGKYDGNGENRFEAAALTGWYVDPDLMVGLDAGVNGFGPGSAGLFSLQPFVAWRKYLRPGTESDCGGVVRAFWYPEPETYKTEASLYTHAGFSDKTVVALTGSGGYSASALPQTAFDLFYTEDRNVRSGYPIEELTASRYVLASAELRYDFLAFKVPPAFDCTVQGFAFFDAAKLEVLPGAGGGFVDAAGGGLRLLFDNPVFAYFTFSYGINHDGDGRFLFCGTAGY